MRMKFGIAIAVAAIAGLFFPMIAVILLVVAGVMIFAGKEPEKAQGLFETLPGGGYVIKGLDYFDNLLK